MFSYVYCNLDSKSVFPDTFALDPQREREREYMKKKGIGYIYITSSRSSGGPSMWSRWAELAGALIAANKKLLYQVDSNILQPPKGCYCNC